MEAERQARRAIRWAPWSAQAWQSLGHAQLGLNDRAGAHDSLLEALERSPGDWSVWYDLGTASEGAAQRRAYEQAERLNPLSRNIDVLRTLGLLPPRTERSR
jgi:Flp pilus assembly protein TadD